MDTQNISDETLVDLMFHLKWKSDSAAHTDVYHACGVNIWRDYMPAAVLEAIVGRHTGEMIDIHVEPEDLVPAAKSSNLFEIKRSQFGNPFAERPAAGPAMGRFYPKGLLRDVSNVFAANRQPFRCVHLNNGHMTVDFNHPLAGRDLSLSALIGNIAPKKLERGGTSVDWLAALTDGPGMQARWRDKPSSFFSHDAFFRQDSEADTRFYQEPRFVQHIDDTAIEIIKATYGRFVQDGMQVLDLMSSWQSHLPEGLKLDRLTGLGLNEKELRRNPLLSDVLVQDLNQSVNLPFESESFDAVLNTVSIEYLVDPMAVFEEVLRVLRPGGYFLVAFSNRWFEPKAVKVWKEIHEFERMGMVLELFSCTEGFTNLQTYSMRGLPRPHNDKYYPDMLRSDPVYIVWGQRS
ncbi:MAG: methyltransferase domain-containing protein [Deltaproteobacteria bacterium]|nr:methyltransferase domain-containing protein [Deltaproteobacteria bacterium]